MGINLRQIGELSQHEQQQFYKYVNVRLRKIYERRKQIRRNENANITSTSERSRP